MDVPNRIEVEDGSLVVLTWVDETVTELSAAELRSACTCAACREGTAVVPPGAEVTIVDTKLVGAYAINFVFGPDGHSSGIYSFDALRALGAAPV